MHDIPVIIHFDGGAAPNPGKGYGSFSYTSADVDVSRSRFPLGKKITNNQAEYLSLIRALKHLKKNHLISNEQPVRIFSDSKLLVNQVGHGWKCKKPHLKELLNQTKQLLSHLHNWSIEWNPRSVNVAKFGH